MYENVTLHAGNPSSMRNSVSLHIVVLPLVLRTLHCSQSALSLHVAAAPAVRAETSQ